MYTLFSDTLSLRLGRSGTRLDGIENISNFQSHDLAKDQRPPRVLEREYTFAYLFCLLGRRGQVGTHVHRGTVPICPLGLAKAFEDADEA